MKINIENTIIHCNAYNLSNKNKELVVFIHGAGFNRTAWFLQSRYIANLGNPTISLDLPGHGYSKSDAVKSIEEMSYLIEKIIKHLGFKKAILIGHSMGSLVAINTGVFFTDLISKVILLGTAKKMKVSQVLLNAAKENISEAIDMVIKFSLPSDVKLNNSNSAPGFWLPYMARKTMSSCALNTLYSDLTACNNFIIDDEGLKKLTIPITIVAGEKDIMTNKKQGLELADDLCNVRFISIENCGHMMMIEKPDRVNAILKSALE